MFKSSLQLLLKNLCKSMHYTSKQVKLINYRVDQLVHLYTKKVYLENCFMKKNCKEQEICFASCLLQFNEDCKHHLATVILWPSCLQKRLLVIGTKWIGALWSKYRNSCERTRTCFLFLIFMKVVLIIFNDL